MTTKPRIEVASFDPLQKQIVVSLLSKCRSNAEGREGDGFDVDGTSKCRLCCSIYSQTKWDWRIAPVSAVYKDTSAYRVNLDWLFGHSNSVVGFSADVNIEDSVDHVVSL